MASLDAVAKRYHGLTVAGLLASIAYMQGSGIASLIGEHLPVAAPAANQGAKPRKTNPTLPKSGAVVLSRNPFDSVTGPLTGKTVAPPPKAPSEPSPATKELPNCSTGNVTLIAGSSDPQFSFAVISSGSESKMRRVGDEIAGQKLESIHGEHVVMAQGTSRCQLRMHTDSPLAAAAGGKTVVDPTHDAPPTTSKKAPIGLGIRKVSETEYVIEQDSADKLVQMEKAFRSSGRVVPGSGFRLHRSSATTVLGQVGLKKGDIVKSINGHDMTDLDATMTAYTQMKSAKSVQIVIERDAKPVTIDIGVK